MEKVFQYKFHLVRFSNISGDTYKESWWQNISERLFPYTLCVVLSKKKDIDLNSPWCNFQVLNFSKLLKMSW